MPIDPDNPNFVLSQENLDLVNRKEREARNVGGMTSSWTGSIADIDPNLIPPERRKLLEDTEAARKARAAAIEAAPLARPARFEIREPSPKSRLVTIPPQAMKAFKQLLNLFEAIQVNLTSEQAKMLLESLEKSPTPKNMVDAKALFNLMEILSQ